MKILIEKKKKEIIDYVSNSKDEDKLDELLSVVHEPDPEYKTFDFEKEWAKGISREESQNRVLSRLAKRWTK